MVDNDVYLIELRKIMKLVDLIHSFDLLPYLKQNKLRQAIVHE